MSGTAFSNYDHNCYEIARIQKTNSPLWSNSIKLPHDNTLIMIFPNGEVLSKNEKTNSFYVLEHKEPASRKFEISQGKLKQKGTK